MKLDINKMFDNLAYVIIGMIFSSFLFFVKFTINPNQLKEVEMFGAEYFIMFIIVNAFFLVCWFMLSLIGEIVKKYWRRGK